LAADPAWDNTLLVVHGLPGNFLVQRSEYARRQIFRDEIVVQT
jgi:hypothetical protein